MLNGVTLVLLRRTIDRPVARYVAAVSQATFYALLICIGGTRQLDLHFYLFVCVAFLAFYRDWRLLALVGVAGFAAQYAYGEVLCVAHYESGSTAPYHQLTSAVWLLIEGGALAMVCNHGSLLFRTIGRDQAQVELEKERSHQELLERNKQIEATNEQYRALLESTSAVPWELDDGSGACRYIGSQVERQWGWAPECFQQESFLFSCVHPDDRPLFAQALEDAVAAHDVSVECRFQLKSGKYAHVRSFVRHAPGEKRRVVRGISIDITTQKKLESELYQAQKLESVGRLASGVAHEINTPVQFVNDNCYFLRDAVAEVKTLIQAYQDASKAVAAGTLAPQQAREQLQAAEQAADLDFLREHMSTAVERALEGLQRVATIVRSMKEFSHPDQTALSSSDLNAALRSTLTIACNEYKYVADIETDLGDIAPVVCHIGELNQVFLNILVNAAHAIGEVVAGTEHRGLITVTTQQDGDHVIISIRDTGGGIPEAIQDKIFDPFFTTKEVGKGTGQGLSIARSVVVDKHRGSLTFETQPGVGTTFIIRIPIDPGREAQEGAIAA